MRKVAIDAGCAYTKVVAFDSNHNLVQKSIPSIVVRGKSTTSLDGSKAPSYMCEGQQWSIIESSTKARETRNDAYPYSDMNTVLIHHALRSAGITTSDIQISTSILAILGMNCYRYINTLRFSAHKTLLNLSLSVLSNLHLDE